MAMMRMTGPLWAILLLAFPAPGRASGPVAGGTHHAYSSEATMHAIRQRNIDVATPLPVGGPAPARNGRISFVVYRWEYAAAPPELAVHLCQQQRCIDVSKHTQGRSEAFAGASPAETFELRARVRGQGGMLPLYGGVAGLIVNWQE